MFISKSLDDTDVKEIRNIDHEWIGLASHWAEKKWGYIHKVMDENNQKRKETRQEANERRKILISELVFDPNHHFFIVTQQRLGKEVPVGMFALRSFKQKNEKILKKDQRFFQPKNGNLKTFCQRKIYELDYVYVDESVRAYGVGRKIVEAAKVRAKALGAEQMVLEILNPNLMRFYKSMGARVVAESRCGNEPVEMMAIDLSASAPKAEKQLSVKKKKVTPKRAFTC